MDISTLIVREKQMIHTNTHQEHPLYTTEIILFKSNEDALLYFQFYDNIPVRIEFDEILLIRLVVAIPNLDHHTFHRFYRQDEHHRSRLHSNLPK